MMHGVTTLIPCIGFKILCNTSFILIFVAYYFVGLGGDAAQFFIAYLFVAIWYMGLIKRVRAGTECAIGAADAVSCVSR